jgi:perosamine synthetase
LSKAAIKESDASRLIPLCAPEIRGNEWKYVKDCLDTGWVSSVGSYVNRFEEMMADYTGSKHAIATVNGTSALHISMLVSGVKAGDEVLISDLTFIAPANAIRYIGAFPVFIDAEPEHMQMDVGVLRKFLKENCRTENGQTINKTSGRRISAIIPVHILGNPVDLIPLLELAEEYKIAVIEDATESLGAHLKNNNKVGTFGKLGCFSFNGNKLLTTGGGGMVVTNDDELANKVRYLTTQAKDDPFEFVHGEIGYNYRLTNVQAAIGCAQLELIDEYITKKKSIADRYNQAFSELRSADIQTMNSPAYGSSVFWLYTISLSGRSRKEVRDIMHALKVNSIDSRPLWQPMHQSPAHKDMQYVGSGVSGMLNDTSISLPCSVGLSVTDHNFVIKTLISLL